MLLRITQGLLGTLILVGVIVTIMALTQEEGSTNYDAILNVAYVYTILTGFLALAGFLYGMALTPKRIIGFAAGVVPLLIIFGVAYGLASDAVPAQFEDLTPNISKLVGTGLYATYVLGGLAVAAVVFSSISKLLK